MKLTARFDFEKVDHSKATLVHLLLTASAPEIDWVEKRPRVFILPVIDNSGSMQGRKLEYAKQACRKLVEQLKPGDYAGLLAFSTQASVLVEPAEVTPELKTQLLKAIDGLRLGGGTNFSEAITKSLEAMSHRDLTKDILHRVIFFTDGQPTEGTTDKVALKGILSASLGALSMSFFGYGEGVGACDQDFLTDLSAIGRGNYAYVQNPDDALAAFGRELGGLLSTYASDLTLTIEPKNGHVISKVLTDVKHDASDVLGITTIDLQNILAEEARHVVLECMLQPQDKAFPRPFTVFDVKATFRRMTPQGLRESEEVTTTARVEFVREKDAQEKPTPEVDTLVSLHKMAVVQKAAEAEADRGNYMEAQRLMTGFTDEVKTKGYVHIGEASSALAGAFRTPGAYVQTQGLRKSLQRGVLRSAGVSSYDPQAASILSDCDVHMGNSAQANYAASFVNDSTNGAPVVTTSASPPLDGVSAAVQQSVTPGVAGPALVVPASPRMISRRETSALGAKTRPRKNT